MRPTVLTSDRLRTQLRIWNTEYAKALLKLHNEGSKDVTKDLVAALFDTRLTREAW